jgi:hypothetical protein
MGKARGKIKKEELGIKRREGAESEPIRARGEIKKEELRRLPPSPRL